MGRVSVCEDSRIIDHFWSPTAARFYPEGRDDRALRLLRMHLTEAEMWGPDPASGQRVRMAFAEQADPRAAAGGERSIVSTTVFGSQ